jgi:hypothetical protein
MAVDVIPSANMQSSLMWAHRLASTIEAILEKGAAVDRLHGGEAK